MSVAAQPATLADLAREPGKAELIGGVVVRHPPAGFRPGRIAGRVVRKLDEHAESTGFGVALGSTVVFAVPELSMGRESFSPDAAYYTGPPPADAMRFVPGPPDFAVEVRSDGDYGPAAELAIPSACEKGSPPELAMAAKRAEYFEAGTLAVWDVDPVAGVVRRYRPGEPTATVFGPGTVADAEPAVPGWRVEVDWLMK